jgi:hypothetical protein
MKSYDIFISYSSTDKETVRKFHRHWKSLGARTFFDEEKMSSGFILENLQKAIRDSHKIVLILSRQSVQRPWVSLERNHAAHEDIIPVMLDEIDFHELGRIDPTWRPFDTLRIIDLSKADTFHENFFRLTEEIMLPAIERKEAARLETAKKSRRYHAIIHAAGALLVLALAILLFIELSKFRYPATPEATDLARTATEADEGFLADSALLLCRISKAPEGKYTLSMRTFLTLRGLKEGPKKFFEEYNSGSDNHVFGKWFSTHPFRRELSNVDNNRYKTELDLRSGQLVTMVTGSDLTIDSLGRATNGKTIGDFPLPAGEKSMSWSFPGYYIEQFTMILYSDDPEIKLTPRSILRKEQNKPVDAVHFAAGGLGSGMSIEVVEEEGFYTILKAQWGQLAPETEIGVVYEAKDLSDSP